MKRLFLAIPFDGGIQNSLHEIALRLKGQIGGRAVRRGNYHLTLRFLGMCDSVTEEAARRALASVPSIVPFELNFGVLGRFVQGVQALLWLGLDGGKGLLDLYGGMAAALAQEGFPVERKTFFPHVTLLRDVPLEVAQKLPPVAGKLPAVKVKRIVLFETVSNPQGMVYRSLTAEDD